MRCVVTTTCPTWRTGFSAWLGVRFFVQRRGTGWEWLTSTNEVGSCRWTIRRSIGGCSSSLKGLTGRQWTAIPSSQSPPTWRTTIQHTGRCFPYASSQSPFGEPIGGRLLRWVGLVLVAISTGSLLNAWRTWLYDRRDH